MMFGLGLRCASGGKENPVAHALTVALELRLSRRARRGLPLSLSLSSSLSSLASTRYDTFVVPPQLSLVRYRFVFRNKSSFLKQPGYTVFRRDRQTPPGDDDRKGGGTAVLIAHNRISREAEPHPNAAYSALETASAIAQTTLGEITLVSCYLPPRHRLPLNDLTAAFDKQSPALLAGDFNAKHADWGSTRNNLAGKHLQGWTTTEGIPVLAPRYPTHFDHKGDGDVLDILLVNRLPPPLAIYTVPALSSDHLPVIAFFGTAPLHKVTTLRRIYRRANSEAFSEQITTSLAPPPDSIKSADDLDTAVALITSSIQAAADTNIPQLGMHHSPKMPLPMEIILAIREKNRLRR
ncbi:hypothetical protein J437_LFUL012165 [Ladona fulva]|uniref:Endonuclease/exonuclease/phosphatase domain-containing protein n=1 Tax=Ladona fulva TaxID=123851 RepID=A0A8K0P6D5_LADFU|nr:hypothetical protein J437_LFUL012165 [Ladona fulva]